MSTFLVHMQCLASTASTEQLEADFGLVADAFHTNDEIFDQDLSLDTGRKLLEFSLAVDAGDELAAFGTALAAVRAALHTAGGGTPGWEQHYELFRQEIERRATDTFIEA